MIKQEIGSLKRLPSFRKRYPALQNPPGLKTALRKFLIPTQLAELLLILGTRSSISLIGAMRQTLGGCLLGKPTPLSSGLNQGPMMLRFEPAVRAMTSFSRHGLKPFQLI